MIASGDTCDRCSAKPKWIVWVGTGLLYFCGHHTREHLSHIKAKGYRIKPYEEGGRR